MLEKNIETKPKKVEQYTLALASREKLRKNNPYTKLFLHFKQTRADSEVEI